MVATYPRTPRFKEDIIQAFYDWIKHKPETTFGNVKADVLADKDPQFVRGNFCTVIRGSRGTADRHDRGQVRLSPPYTRVVSSSRRRGSGPLSD